MRSSRMHRSSLLVLGQAVLLTFVIGLSSAQAQDANAQSILKKMSDYIGAQTNIQASIDTDVEIITPELQKIQFSSSIDLSFTRPDKFRARRVGGYSDVDLIFDGGTATLLGRHLNLYGQIKQSGGFPELIAALRNNYGAEVPGADLLLPDAASTLMTDIAELRHIGRGVINGVECEHLAARGHEIDWQLWVEVGARPIPRKFVITSKTVAQGPQYTMRVKTWTSDKAPAADAYVFKAPEGAKLVDMKAMPNIDEVPAGILPGAKK